MLEFVFTTLSFYEYSFYTFSHIIHQFYTKFQSCNLLLASESACLDRLVSRRGILEAG